MTANEVLRFLEENDLKFIRLSFTDLSGQMKNIAILPEQLAQAFDEGVAFDPIAVEGCEKDPGGDLLLRPDPDTLCVLPWRPQTGGVCRLICDLAAKDGRPWEGDCRGVLRQAVTLADEAGLDVRIGTDCEFYLLELDGEGRPLLRPHDQGGYLDVAPLDRCEDVRRDIILTLEKMNIRPESSHHERGRGQNEVDFHRAEPLTAADHYATFVHAVRTVASRYGVHATFLPKPLKGEIGNGLHVSLSFYREGTNLFRMEKGVLGREARSAMAGVLARLPEITLFLNPLPSGYERLQGGDAFFRNLRWSFQRETSALRIPLPQEHFARMQLSSPDPTMNVYLGFALLIRAALEGMAQGLELTAELECGKDKGLTLPLRMEEALALARESDFVARALPPSVRASAFAKAEKRLERYARDPEGLLAEELLRY